MDLVGRAFAFAFSAYGIEFYDSVRLLDCEVRDVMGEDIGNDYIYSTLQ